MIKKKSVYKAGKENENKKKHIWIGLTWIQIIKLYVIAVEFVNDLITHL